MSAVPTPSTPPARTRRTPGTSRPSQLVVIEKRTCFFFFSSRRRHTRCLSDWSSDVCSSDLNSEVRKYVYSELDKSGFKYISSHANFLMIDLRKEASPIVLALRGRGVEVGRVFPALPKFLRVTIGTRPQMETFLSVFREVMT